MFVCLPPRLRSPAPPAPPFHRVGLFFSHPRTCVVAAAAAAVLMELIRALLEVKFVTSFWLSVSCSLVPVPRTASGRLPCRMNQKKEEKKKERKKKDFFSSPTIL